MTPTTHDEALAELLCALADARVTFLACAQRLDADVIQAAVLLRAEQCARTLVALSPFCGVCLAEPVASPLAADANPLAVYDELEARVLSGFRDLLDQPLQPPLQHLAVSHFESALNGYMQIASLRPATPRHRPRRIVPTGVSPVAA